MPRTRAVSTYPYYKTEQDKRRAGRRSAGVCTGCGRHYQVRHDGKMRAHWPEGWDLCPGSNLPPRGTVEEWTS